MSEQETLVIWEDGKEDQAIEVTVPLYGADAEALADTLGCDIEALNMCSPGQMDFYGVTLK